jgi:hypothetical protein
MTEEATSLARVVVYCLSSAYVPLLSLQSVVMDLKQQPLGFIFGFDPVLLYSLRLAKSIPCDREDATVSSI